MKGTGTAPGERETIVTTLETLRRREERATLNGLRKRTLIAAAIFAAVSCVFMLYYTVTRSMFIRDVVTQETQAEASGYELTREDTRGAQDKPDLVIPLPPRVHYEDIRIDNHYMTRQLFVYVRAEDDAFFHDSAIPCDAGKVRRAICTIEPGGEELCLRFDLDSLYEYDLSLEDNSIRLFFVSPAERYERVVVVDPVHTDSVDTALQIATRIREIAESGGTSLRVYVTRTEDEEADEVFRSALVTDAGAVRYLRLAVMSGSGTQGDARIYFNDAYFIREYGNLQFAADVANAVARTNTMQVTAVERMSEEQDLLYALKVPSCALAVEGLSPLSEAETDRIAQELIRVLSRTEET